MAFEGGGFSRSSSSRGAAGGAASYQNAAAGEGSAWASVVTQVEDELRRFTALSAQLKKSVDLVGSARDSEEVRQRIAAALARGKESVDGISALLRTKLAEAAGKEEAGLSAKDRAARKTQQQRFEKDWLTVSSAYKDTLGQWQEKSRKHPAPAKAGGAGGAGGSKQKYPSVGSSSSTSSKAEEEASLKLQLVNFEEGLLEEREEAILGIAQQISEVNETFRDLAQIVEEQGQGIDLLETNTGAAEANTKDGVGQLQEAEKHQKGYRKWILIMMIIIVLAAVGIAAWQLIGNERKSK